MPSKEVEKVEYTGDSLVAAAQKMGAAAVGGRTLKKNVTANSWQTEAWELYREVGELRFLTNTLAGRASQATLFVGKNEDSAGAEPTRVDTGPAYEALQKLGGGPSGIVRLLKRGVAGLFVAAEATITGVPREWLDLAADSDGEYTVPADGALDPDIDSLEWATLSSLEVKSTSDDKLDLTFRGVKLKDVPVESVYTISLWNPDPGDYTLGDSPVRSALPVLRELVGLTSHVSAQIDSRLAGAGVLFVPSSMNKENLTDALIEAMSTAIADRAAASAVVPLVVTATADEIKAAQHMTFSSPLDAEARELREEAIRRLALSLDAPPEVLLGTSGANHWGAWLIKEDTVTTHVEPPLALIVEAITTQYLRPYLESTGMSAEEAGQYSVWYDVSDIIESPNRFDEALQMFDRGAISLQVLREAGGFTDKDAPGDRDAREEAVEIVKELVKGAPSLAANVADLVDQWEAVLSGKPVSTETEDAVDDAVNDLDEEDGAAGSDAGPETPEPSLNEGPPSGGVPTP